MSARIRAKSVVTLSACLLLIGCAAYDPGPPQEIVVNKATAGLSDAEVATVFWDHGMYRIDELSEPAFTRDSMFSFRYARLLPGEHHFFMSSYHNKSNYEYNWVHGHLAAGGSYRVERSETAGLLGGTTLWVIRDLTSDDVIARSVDCHNYCVILDYLYMMHTEDRAASALALDGSIALRLPTDFGERYAAPDRDPQQQLATISTTVAEALYDSELPIVPAGSDGTPLTLTISNLELMHMGHGTSFPVYGLSRDYQVIVAFEAALTTEAGAEIDRWQVAAAADAPNAGLLDLWLEETGNRALENATVRLSERLVYDLERRFLGARRRNVLFRLSAARNPSD